MLPLFRELDTASQGETFEGATKNLREPRELFLESVSDCEVSGRLRREA